MSLDDKQLEAFNAVKRGDNVFITGEAGSGKTFIVKYIINYLRTKFKNNLLGITATTGIAAKLLGGKTLHSLLGLPIGNLDIEKFKIHLNYKKYLVAKWKKLKVLLIDEISMLSADLFELIDNVARFIKKKNIPFGGIQMVLVGDFFQLSPVNGDFCFKSKIWKKTIACNILLKNNYRQKDDVYSRICNEFRTNSLTDDTINLLEKISSKNFTLPKKHHNMRPTSLFCTNKNVDKMNYLELERLDTEEKTFASVDSHDALVCDKMFNIQSTIVLKVGAQVMLLKNLTDELCNGSIGIVCVLNDDSVIVDFYGVGKVKISYESFESIDEVKDCIVTRKQIPLTLSYALTMHKSQGQSISLLEVDFKNCFCPGQAYVAISRGTSIENLYVKNFSREVVIVDDDVVQFYNNLETHTCDKKRKFSSVL